MKINSKSILEKVDYYIDIMLLNEQEDSENNSAMINKLDDECCKHKEKDYDNEDEDENEKLQILHDDEEGD